MKRWNLRADDGVIHHEGSAWRTLCLPHVSWEPTYIKLVDDAPTCIQCVARRLREVNA